METSKKYKLKSWIDENKLNFYFLSSYNESPGIIDLLETNSDKIDWTSLSLNPRVIRLLEVNPDKD